MQEMNNSAVGIEKPSLFTLPAQQSADIYKEFVNGRVVTKLIYDNIGCVNMENPLFTLLFTRREEFELLYKLIGFSLDFNEQGDFFSIKSLTSNQAEDDDISDVTAMKIQACLLMLGRYFVQSNISVAQLGMAKFGINETDIDNLKSNSEFASILKTAGLKSWDDALRFISERNIAFKTGKSSYFISSAGMYYLNKIVPAYSERFE